MIAHEGLHPGDQRQVLDARNVREVPFPEDPQQRFEAVFAAIGNSEAKCVTLLTMQPYPMTAGELYGEFLRATNRVWITSNTIQAQYARTTLSPIGLVAQEDFITYGSSEYVTGYRTTDAGEKYGKPIATFLLQKSSEIPQSLLQIFGLTSKSGGETRSVLNITKILDFLNSKAEDYHLEIDVASQLNLGHQIVGRHLERLRRLGLVEYSSTSNEVTGARYFVVGKLEPKLHGRTHSYPTMTQKIFQIVSGLEVVNRQTVAEELNRRNPGIKTNLSLISVVLRYLTDQGILSREFGISKRRGGNKSRARITDEGRKLIEGVIMPIKLALGPDGEDLLTKWGRIPWQGYAEDAVRKHKEQSGSANRRSLEAWTSDALRIIRDNPGIRPGELERKLKRSGIEPLQILLRDGSIVKVRLGKAVRYYTADHTRSS